jgi:putative ABC transport system permease protein
MVKALRKRVWRILIENKGRYVGIVILILIGSFYYIAAIGVSGNLERMVVAFADEYRQEDLTFSADRSIENIALLEREFSVLIEPYQQYDVKLPGGELRLFSISSRINMPVVLSGRAIEASDDILLDPKFCQKQDLNIGDQLELNGKTFNITGTMALPNYVYIIKNLYDVLPTSGFGIGIVSGADIFPDADIVYAAYFKNRYDINAQVTRLHEILTEQGYFLTEWLDAKSNMRINMPWGNINSMKSMSLPVAVFFFLLGCFIAGVMILRMVKSDCAVIGTLYAQGCRRSELTLHYMSIPVLLSAIGSLAGLLLALPCVKPVFESFFGSSYIIPNTGISFSPLNLVLAVLIPVTIVGLSGFMFIHKMLKKTAIELMKGDEQKAKANFLEHILHLDRFSFTAKFQIREQVRSIPRLLFLLLGVSTASMILLYGLTFNYSMEMVLKRGVLDRYVYAIEYNFKETQNIQDRPLPEGAEPYSAIRCYPEGRERVEFYLLGMEVDSVGLKANGKRGVDLPRNQVNITYPLASRLRLKEGDTINFVNKLDGKSYHLKIDGMIESYSEQYVFMPLAEFNRMTGQAPGSYRTVLSNHEMDFDENLLTGVMDARDPEAFKELSGTTMLIITVTTIVAVLVAIIIIYLVISLMIDESRKSISLLKVFGYHKKELAKLILNSSTPVVFIGFWLGLPLMLAFGNGINTYLTDISNMLVPMIVTPLFILLGFVLIFVAYEITKRLCGRNIAKISMSEALKAGAE